MRRGVPLSSGVAIAHAFRMDEALIRTSGEAVDPAAETVRFDSACQVVAGELDATIARVAREVSEQAADIFRGHRALLRDPALVGKVRAAIALERIDAQTALNKTLEDYRALFSQIPDEYLRERMADIRDVIGRLLGQLAAQTPGQQFKTTDPVVLIAKEILPSHMVMFDRLSIAGIVTERGGSIGHAAILARSMGIPAVSDIAGLLKDVRSGDLLVVDGREGVVLLNPGPEVESIYRKLQREYVDLRNQLVENRDHAPVTADGVPLEFLANVNNMMDAATAVGVGASGVGLFRTEFIFLTHPGVPSEDEQVLSYRNIIEACPVGQVTIRVLDLGGDKQVPYLGNRREANPFIGFRSIRLMADYPELFRTQLRAMLRASSHGNVAIMFPMVSRVEEVVQLRKFLEEVKADLSARGIALPARIPFGVMIEVPAAALCIHEILDLVDFVSVGTNDLTQYLMAADRDNPKVAHLVDPCHPAVLRLLHPLIGACVQRDKPVTLCGEMAGTPRCLLPLLGMGLRRFSMAPAFIATMKELAKTITLADARQAAEKVIGFRTLDEVREFLNRKLKELCPKVAALEAK